MSSASQSEAHMESASKDTEARTDTIGNIFDIMCREYGISLSENPVQFSDMDLGYPAESQMTDDEVNRCVQSEKSDDETMYLIT